MYHTCKNDCSWNSGTRICENSRYLKSTVGNSVSVCDDIINDATINMTSTISTNVKNTVSITLMIKK